jgi:serine/threonine protein kinase
MVKQNNKSSTSVVQWTQQNSEPLYFNLFVQMEYCGSTSGPCNLEEAMQSKLPSDITDQLTESINCIHRAQIAHRDLKAKNIFL